MYIDKKLEQKLNEIEIVNLLMIEEKFDNKILEFKDLFNFMSESYDYLI